MLFTNTKTGDGVWQKNLLSVNLLITGKRDVCIHILTLYRGSLAFMVPELIIEELLMASVGIDELKTVGVWAVSMTFFTILNLVQSYPFQNDLKNIPNKVTSNMKADFK